MLLRDGGDSYVYGPDGTPLQRIASDGTVTYVHSGMVLGSVRALTDSSGSVVGTFAFDAYGNSTGTTGTATMPFGFAGEYLDQESGLVYLRARYYDPSTAQFISRDPLVAMTKSPYAYVAGNPLNAVDPSGLWGWSNVKKFARDHGAKIVAGVAVAAAGCALVVACGLAVAAAVSTVNITAGNALLLGAAGIGPVGVVMRALGGAPAKAPDRGASYETRLATAQAQYPNKAGTTELHHICPKYLGGTRRAQQPRSMGRTIKSSRTSSASTPPMAIHGRRWRLRSKSWTTFIRFGPSLGNEGDRRATSRGIAGARIPRAG